MAAGPSAEYRRRPGAGSREESAPAESASAPLAKVTAPRRSGLWRILRIASGFALLALGIVGLFLPVLQGVLMILAGLAILGRDFPWSRAITDRLAAFVKRRASRDGQRGKPAARPEAS